MLGSWETSVENHVRRDYKRVDIGLPGIPLTLEAQTSRPPKLSRPL